MSAPLTQERLTAINNAVRQYREARATFLDAEKLAPIRDNQEIYVGRLDAGGSLYRTSIEVPLDVIRRLLRDRATAAKAKMDQARRLLAQLNVEVPA